MMGDRAVDFYARAHARVPKDDALPLSGRDFTDADHQVGDPAPVWLNIDWLREFGGDRGARRTFRVIGSYATDRAGVLAPTVSAFDLNNEPSVPSLNPTGGRRHNGPSIPLIHPRWHDPSKPSP
jgi:hypothetical protein